MSVHYEVKTGETLTVRGPINVRITGNELPLVGNPASPPAAPAISSLTPNTIAVTSPPITVTVTGTGFTFNSRIMIGLVDVPTTYVSATSLKTTITPSQFVAGTQNFAVRNGPQISNTSTFTFT